MKIITLEKKDLLKAFAAICIFTKVTLYYHYMEVSHNYIYILIMTLAYIAMVFFSFENKIYSAILYFIFSVIMFLDVGYFSYFNRNLSVDMIEAFGFLDDVTDSILEVVKPKFFLILVDSVLILLYFIRQEKRKFPTHDSFIRIYPSPKIKYIKSLMLILVLTFLILSVSGQIEGDVTTSIVNQEFFSYHISDIANYLKNEQNVCYKESFKQINTEYQRHVGKEWFGIGKDKNLIVIQVESLQDFVINKTYNGQQITPFLNALIQKDSFYFPNYFQQLGGGNTSDAEFVTHNSLYASFKSYTYSLYKNSYFRGLPWILKEKGYQTAAFHGYKKDFWCRAQAYPNQGFDEYYCENSFELDEVVGLGLSDGSFFNQSIDHLKNMQQPYYGFLITLSTHHPYIMPEEKKMIKLKDGDEESIFGNYIHAANYIDQCLEAFVKELKANGLYENTVIAIYGDHFGLNCKDEKVNKDVSDFLGFSYYYDEMMNIPLIIHVPNSKAQETIQTVGGHIDFLPTIAYLMGIKNLDTLFFGRNLIHANSGFVASQTYMLKGSFIQDGIVFEMSRDGIFSNSKAWDLETKKPVDINLCEEGYQKSVDDINLGNFLLENEILSKIYQNGQTLQEVFKMDNHSFESDS